MDFVKYFGAQVNKYSYIGEHKVIFVEPACGKARHSSYYFAKVYVRACMWIFPGHNSYIKGWMSKLFDTVVVLEKEKCRLKHI